MEMNWKTRDLLREAEKIVSDEGVFSPDQICLLVTMVQKIAEAIDRQAGINNPSYTM